MNLDGGYVTLLIGKTVPVPAKPELLRSLEQVEVSVSQDQPSGFQIRFRASRGGPLAAKDYPLLQSSQLNPFLPAAKGYSDLVEFEGDDPNHPIWSGCFWLEDDVPANPAIADIKVLKTEHVRLEINEGEDQSQAGVLLEIDNQVVPNALKVVMNSNGIEINHGDTRIVRLTEETIEIVHSDQAKITLTEKDIELATDPVSINLLQGDPAIKLEAGSSTSGQLNGETVQMKQGEVEWKLSASGVEAKSGPGSVKVSSQGVQLDAAPATLKVEAAGIELNYGAGGSVKMNGPAVNINNGAMEVTYMPLLLRVKSGSTLSASNGKLLLRPRFPRPHLQRRSDGSGWSSFPTTTHPVRTRIFVRTWSAGNCELSAAMTSHPRDCGFSEWKKRSAQKLPQPT